MGFADAVKTALTKYVVFSGRARRSEYWWFTLFLLVVYVVAAIVDGLLGTYPLVYGLVILGLLLPSIAVGVRRLHDTDRSGWFYLLSLIPLVGAIILLVFFVGDSKPANQYGPSPKEQFAA